MSRSGLVLFKSGRQRLAESLVLPALIAPIGPLLRGYMGDNYVSLYGLLVALAVLLLQVRIGAWIAPQFGGEGVPPEERMARLIAEMKTAPVGLTIMFRTLSLGATMSAMLLTIAPWDDLEGFLGGRSFVLAYLGLLAVLGSVPVLLSRHRLKAAVIIAAEAPAGEVRADLRRILPRIYAGWGIGTLAGVAAARQMAEGGPSVYIVVCLGVSLLVQFALLAKTPVRRLYAGPSGLPLGRAVLIGLSCWGIPMAFVMGGSTLLDVAGTIPLWIGILIAALSALLGGALFGTFLYVLARLNDARRRETA